MPLGLATLFPNINIGLNSIGFLFGAGTSKEAGYPLTNRLTIDVFQRLHSSKQILIKEILSKEGMTFSEEEGYPDIETITDLVLKYSISPDLEEVAEAIRENILKELTSVQIVTLEHHIKFLASLKILTRERPEVIWLFTTNYDLLFEMAAMETEIPIYNGFDGTLFRYFDFDKIKLKRGHTTKREFFEERSPRIQLIKLHGSVSWFKKEERVYETCECKSPVGGSRIMVLPRRQKVIDTLEHPYDKLFRYAREVIGTQCKYIVTCGYSFRDQHVNEQLMIPSLKEGKVRLFGVVKEKPPIFEELMKYPSFNYLSEDEIYINGVKNKEDSDLWQFSKFASLFASRVGI